MTRGNALALGIAHEIGTLEPGSHADITVLDLAPTPAIAHRLVAIDRSDLPALLFALMTMGDDRAIRATWVAGKKLHERNG
jgi:guanine deaminase